MNGGPEPQSWCMFFCSLPSYLLQLRAMMAAIEREARRKMQSNYFKQMQFRSSKLPLAHPVGNSIMTSVSAKGEGRKVRWSGLLLPVASLGVYRTTVCRVRKDEPMADCISQSAASDNLRWPQCNDNSRFGNKLPLSLKFCCHQDRKCTWNELARQCFVERMVYLLLKKYNHR